MAGEFSSRSVFCDDSILGERGGRGVASVLLFCFAFCCHLAVLVVLFSLWGVGGGVGGACMCVCVCVCVCACVCVLVPNSNLSENIIRVSAGLFVLLYGLSFFLGTENVKARKDDLCFHSYALS